ncbi:hypothetical protein M092_0459 [Parabacteroides distasonis str. 3776 D15 iv]|uniref:Uncharacterized protein n=1 Tax=Parabacteroides distasonis str. 3776 D15 i TaxID=1339342 RepID=A0AB34L786_PARDI|nr:hypothetical protein M091_0486 [Parabacteroides distasonis str. 3776 D15 i]KDS44689.1 hypothetical protein M090_4425 [Parabacteroides distasonis str. 3776 Po2 i]KDS73446.1 hypothetical protein M092_0459 [Parabacteroides distasonis str. 3776 D15 iv]KEJ86233.1 hypothetical protein HMPREF1002_00437 [Porphyromonas sp. 31_2]
MIVNVRLLLIHRQYKAFFNKKQMKSPGFKLINVNRPGLLLIYA